MRAPSPVTARAAASPGRQGRTTADPGRAPRGPRGGAGVRAPDGPTTDPARQRTGRRCAPRSSSVVPPRPPLSAVSAPSLLAARPARRARRRRHRPRRLPLPAPRRQARSTGSGSRPPAPTSPSIKATEGTTVDNAWFADDWADARAAGLYRGAYHFARPSTAAGSAARRPAVRRHHRRPDRARHAAAGARPREQRRPHPRPADRLDPRVPRRRWRPLTGRTPGRLHLPVVLADLDGRHRRVRRLPAVDRALHEAAPAHAHRLGDWTFWQYTSTARSPASAATST